MKPLSDRLTDRVLLQRGDLTLCYRARDAVLERAVFVKVLAPALAGDVEIRARFEREAKAVARLDHPNLVRIYEYGEDPQEGMYMLLEWVDGTTLAQQTADGKRFAGDEFGQLARELLAGLAALHSVGILHRDLKPENILVRQIPAGSGDPARRRQFKITDFSLAALRDAPKLTHHEAIVGTPAYMAPEQAAGGQPTEQSDLFSLGVVLYEAATGGNPLIGETMLDTLRKIRESDVSFEHAAIASLPSDARDLLEKLLKKSPEERPASAEDALALLGGTSLSPPASRGKKSRARDIRFAIMAIVVLVIGIKLIVDTGKTQTSNVKLQTPKEIISGDTANPSFAQPDTNLRVQSVPEFRNPVTDTTKTKNQKLKTKNEPVVTPPTNGVEMTDTLAVAVTPDSVDLVLTTEPWAHVFLRGEQLGTTPLHSPLRLPSGAQTFVLRNPAYPPVELTLSLNGSLQRDIHLQDYVTTVRARVEPWGELYVDGEHIGTTPLTRPLYISPGRHQIRISHPTLPTVQRDVVAAAGQSLDLEANLNDGSLHVMMDAEGQ